MIKRILFVAVAAACTLAACALTRDFAGENLRYKVLYRWGLINKTAGYADIRMLAGNGATCSAQLTAASEPWADRIYRVRDTLNTTMRRADFSPVYYEKIAHEGNEYKHDIVRFSRSGYRYTGDCVRYVEKKGKVFRDETRTLEAEGTTVDMLSSFYVMRNLPFEKWQPGHCMTINIFSGKQKEKLTFKYAGVEEVSLKGKKYSCYHITFVFTGKNQTKTSDNMDAWISTGNERLPLKLEGKLPVGKVQCELVSPF
ncbi:MAG: DUF3108 domain-containing protein [Muribaculaceae bacterium]|nr:DUF3108 domain-containing protein [Muribaculaceae bacterium]